ncbi:MAG TPA: hypothetical protein VGJ97_06685 [Anaerolineaceae bacterium]
MTETRQSDQNRPQNRRAWHFAWAGLFYAAMAVVFTWPLVLHMGSQFVGPVGDNIYFVWLIEWARKALFDLHISPVFVPFLNYPAGWNLAFTEITPAQLAIAIPASLVAGPYFGYNFTLLATFCLSGLTMYIWIHHLTGSRGAALVAGMVFGFLPFHVAHFLIGHLNLTGTQWLPLFFMGLYDLLRSPRFSWKPVLLAGVSLGLVGLTSQYYLYMCILVSAVFVLVYLLRMPRRVEWLRGVWKNALGFGVVAFPLVLVSVMPFLQLSGSGAMPDRGVGYVSMYSASPTDFFLPSTDHFLFGQWVGTHFDRSLWIEGSLYIGAVALALGIVAFVRRKETRHPTLVIALVWVAAFAFVMALGTSLHWNNQTVLVNIPTFLQRWIHRTTAPIPLPSYFMFLYFPFYAKMRALMRFGLFALVATSALAGLGAGWVLGRVRPGRRALVTGLLVALVFLDFYPGTYTQFSDVQPRPVDAWLAPQPGAGAVAQFPFAEEVDQQQTYYSQFHGKPFIGGFFAAFEPPQYMQIKPVLDTFPSTQSAALLRKLGVAYVVVDTARYPDFAAVGKQIEALGLAQRTVQGAEVVYEWK